MTGIRPLRRSDVPQVAALYQQVMRSGGAPPPGLAAYFERTFLDYPWADPDIPSLVHEAPDGGVSGFLGSHVRRLRFDGRPIRTGCSGQLVAGTAARRRGVGALLLRRYLAGPQDLTITDGATEEVRRLWERLGGQTSLFRSLGWTRVLKPWQVAGDALLRRGRLERSRRAARPVWPVLDALTPRVLRARPPIVSTVQLTPAALVDELPALAGRLRLRLRPDYDEAFARWLFDEAAAVRSRGQLVHHLVRDPGGRLLGWYVAYLLHGGTSHVLQVAAAEQDTGTVLDALFAAAQEHGSTAVRGRLEPLLYEALTRRRCLFRPSELALVHARDPELLAAALSGGLLTRLEGEWWMGHHTEDFSEPPREGEAQRWTA